MTIRRMVVNGKGKTVEVSEGIKRLPWCLAEYPYTGVCFAAENGLILNRAACECARCENLAEERFGQIKDRRQ